MSNHLVSSHCAAKTDSRTSISIAHLQHSEAETESRIRTRRDGPRAWTRICCKKDQSNYSQEVFGSIGRYLQQNQAALLPQCYQDNADARAEIHQQKQGPAIDRTAINSTSSLPEQSSIQGSPRGIPDIEENLLLTSGH
ncbi:hypothetical protein TgHK011_004721 [Trichoderma gracile]|nr:hypothetical protein TgHK011_004721 [Trichoderma gracile]